MKTAGEIISGFFGKQFEQKARGYSKFYSSWKDITEKNGVGTAADYSRIKDLEKGIVLIELDHPGWKQILQTKQRKFLYDFQYRFPELNITGISLMLGNSDVKKEDPLAKTQRRKENNVLKKEMPNSAEQSYIPKNKGLNEIKDDDLKNRLKQLEKTVKENEDKYFN